MSIRKIIQHNSGIATAAAAVVIIGAMVMIVMHLTGGRSAGAAATQAYFSIDDGASWFADDINKVPPFTVDGKEAARAYVYRCGSDKPFVAYLMRYTPEGKKIVEDAIAKAKAQNTSMPNPEVITELRRSHGEVKKPLGGAWASAMRDPAAYAAAMKLSCPSGDMNDLEMVMP